MLSSVSPALTPPSEDAPVTTSGFELTYVKRSSAEGQAAVWNEVLADDPVLGPSSGLVVGVGPRANGRYPLVWVRAAAVAA